MLFTEKKMINRLDEIRETVYRHTKNIEQFKYMEAECDGAQNFDFNDEQWTDFRTGDAWGGYDKIAWFRTKVTIPPEWRREKVVLRFSVGPRDGGGSTAESLLYVNGSPLQGLDRWHEEVWLSPELLQEKELQIAIKAWSGVLQVPDRRRFKVAQLAVVDEPAEQYVYLADALLKTVFELNENDLKRITLMKFLNDSLKRIDFLKKRSVLYYESIRNAAEFLQKKVEQLSELEELKPTITALGHSHIDMAWLWRLKHTREKASRTFSTVLHLMRQYPEYRFVHTSPQLYKYLKEDYPEIYAQIKARIESGEWEATGGMWVEPDANLPGGESLVRQLLFGKRFMKEEFGVENRVAWLPDVFGYPAALPQILKKAGIDYFMTSKISWNQYNRFPYDTFWWRGIDGSEILTHFITTPESDTGYTSTYNGIIEPKSIKGTWDSYKQKDINEELLIAFGWGDGGGGPTKEMLETARVLKNLPGLPRVEMGKAESYFQRLGKRVENRQIPLWDGELYLEFHRGTYTSQGVLKRANRQAEALYHDAEWLAALADSLSGMGHYPAETLNKGWEMILLNQFHDILPGSSIRQVKEDAVRDYKKVLRTGRQVVREAGESVASQIKTPADSLVVFNSLSFIRDGLIAIPATESGEEVTIVDENGMPSPNQTIETEKGKQILLKAAEVPALGYKTFQLANVSGHEDFPSVSVQTRCLENQYYKIRLNEKGQIVSLADKKAGREVLPAHENGNVFQVFEDKPLEFDAWDIDLYYQEKMKEIIELTESQVIENGPLRGSLKLKWKFSDSTVTQFLTLFADSPRIDFRTEVDWQEKQTLLKVAFPVNIRSARATYGIQFGSIERPTHWNTSWDYARFESIGHKWVDLSEGNYGISLLNDCKYGHDIKDRTMRLTLIKSSVYPDETADRGKHLFTYSLFPHEGDWKEAGVVEEAYNFNYPLFAKKAPRNRNGTFPSHYQFASTDDGHILIETIKKAEDDQAWVIRLFEYKQNRNQKATISFGRLVKKAFECNLMEEEEREAECQDNRLHFSIAPYEIKTFKVYF